MTTDLIFALGTGYSVFKVHSAPDPSVDMIQGESISTGHGPENLINAVFHGLILQDNHLYLKIHKESPQADLEKNTGGNLSVPIFRLKSDSKRLCLNNKL